MSLPKRGFTMHSWRTNPLEPSKLSQFLTTSLIFAIILLSPVSTLSQTATPTVKLTVTKAGNGSGTVASSPAGIVCDPTCSANYSKETVVSLTAVPVSGSTFASWTGCDTISGNGCLVSMKSDRTVTATFTTAQPTLVVNKVGNGNGQIISSPPGINCDPACNAAFNNGTAVTLTATPDPGSLFGSWSGCEVTSGTNCTIAANANKSVTVSFNPKPVTSFTLTVKKNGAGLGTIASTPPGVSCSPDCPSISNTFKSETILMLVATPLTNVPTAISTFGGWAGCDVTFSTSCIVAMEDNRTVTVTFDAVPPMLNLAKTGSGSGLITSTPLGLKCGTTCVAAFLRNTSITLAVTPSANSVFGGWTGCDSISGNACTVNLKTDRTVTAAFNAVSQKTLTVTKPGAGLGKVTSNETPDLSGAINCGSICQAVYAQGTTLTLAASPAAGSFFSGWNGCDAVSARVCTVTLNADRTVAAIFTTSVMSTLIINVKGTGSGKVTGPNLNCDPTCVAAFIRGTVVNLNALPLAGSTFGSWSGCDTTSGKTCSLTLNADRIVTATFNFSQVYLAVKIAGSGSGKVSGSGINCNPGCVSVYTKGTIITLNASASAGSAFAGWSGCDTTSGKTCSLTLNADRTVTATFNSTQANLAVVLNGTGSGKVTGKGIVCDPICAAVYAKGTVVSLTATPASNSTFAGWTGCGTVTTGLCTVTLNADKAVTATFKPKS